jgi:hypothetical protein
MAAVKDDDDSTVNREIFGDLGGDDVSRQSLSREDLMDRLTKMIQSCEGCEKVRVVGITRLDFPDKDGRNWSRSIVLDPAGVKPEVYSLAYGAVIGTAHETWNLK